MRIYVLRNHISPISGKRYTNYKIKKKMDTTLSEGLIWYGDDDDWNVQRLRRSILDKTKMTPNDLRSSTRPQLPTPQMTNNQGDVGAHAHGRGEFDEYYDISYHPNLGNLDALNVY